MIKQLYKIPNCKDWSNLKEIKVGYDPCKKFFYVYQGEKYIIKIFKKEFLERKKREYDILKRIRYIDFNKPIPIVMDRIDDNNYYYIVSWIDGEMLKDHIKDKDGIYVYQIGKKIGNVISKLHENKIYDVDLNKKIEKIKDKYPLFEKLQYPFVNDTLSYLKNNVNKLKMQPKSIVHGDLNEDNIVIMKQNEIGIIDFGNSDVDYCYQDMHQIQMYNRFLSIPLSVGIIDGYLDSNLENEKVFWECFKIYSAYYCLSKIVWSFKYNDEILTKEMVRRAEQTVKDFDWFKEEKPNWYLEYKN